MGKKHILVVDDDEVIRNLLTKYLKKNNYFVSDVERTSKINAILEKYKIDLIILDYMLPDESGIDFLQKFRKDNSTPVIMLTALGDIENRIEGLSSGADDYLGKPFEPKELLLRMENIFKKIDTNKDKNEAKFGSFTFNFDKMELFNENEFIKLTDTEISLLKFFLQNTNKIITREEICNTFNEISERSVDVQITRLRKKIEFNPKIPSFLKTIRNKGYIFSI